jgi:hypothetical protein
LRPTARPQRAFRRTTTDENEVFTQSEKLMKALLESSCDAGEEVPAGVAFG